MLFAFLFIIIVIILFKVANASSICLATDGSLKYGRLAYTFTPSPTFNLTFPSVVFSITNKPLLITVVETGSCANWSVVYTTFNTLVLIVLLAIFILPPITMYIECIQCHFVQNMLLIYSTHFHYHIYIFYFHLYLHIICLDFLL